ncbi:MULTISPECIES: hypothetical protein [Shouchella]|uniref:Aminodeoxychorismate lyase n=1 Tax=Shouchella clausii TaxID=79880 RepID=A0A268P4C9_SHOCL|nr:MULTISPECIES: hypothetical protein [Shouchella]MCM3312488.1 hypothetical protein [Psychrobacillus sp. MER TA 17]KKI86274.1 hypothetical protein WZ76_11455 [Shouchella clausii]MBX0318407.1 hypothetical protein [Shouchella clausii]MDO7268480.1 hypothetical protein [Shouchella clausii]MDO7282967.1 hypothetical protein [Shouchella clausii]
MSPKSLRSFACGLLVAAVALGAVYFIQGDGASSAAAPELTEDEMKQSLAEAGYVIEQQDTWDQMESDLQEAQAALEDATQNEDGDSEERIVYRTILHVQSGMTSIDVGQMLEEAGIVDNAHDFFDAVDERGLSNELKPQVTGELSSEMSMDEILDELF